MSLHERTLPDALTGADSSPSWRGEALIGADSSCPFIIPTPPSPPLQLTTRHLQQQQMAGLSSVFHSLDGDRSGALSPKELKRALTEVGAHMSDEDVRRIFEFVSPSLSSSPLLSFPLS